MKKTGKIGDIILSFAVGAQQLLASIQIVMGKITQNPEQMANFRVVSSAFVVILSLLWIIKRKPVAFLVSYSIIALVFIWSLLLTPQLSKYIVDEGVKFSCLTCMPITLAVLCIKDKEVFHKTFLAASILTSLIGIAYSLLLVVGYIIQDDYNIAFGYSLMLPTLYFFYTKRPSLILLGIISTICIVIEGSRGPAAVIPLYVAYLYYRNLNMKSIIMMLLGIILIYIFFSNIDLFLSFLSSHGIRSRTLQKLLNNELLMSASREDLSSLGINIIWKSPILGFGAFGDRLFYEPYIHNFILEVFIDYGIPMGLFLLLLIIIKIVEKFKMQKGEERDFLVLLVLGSILPLMVSSSYLIDFRFFFLIGVLVRPVKKNFSLLLKKKINSA